jgi:IS5 family transposase
MKLHIGTVLNSNIIHTATVTSANESDVGQMSKLLRKNDEVIMGDAGYTGENHKQKVRAEGKIFLVTDKRKPKHYSTPRNSDNKFRNLISNTLE